MNIINAIHSELKWDFTKAVPFLTYMLRKLTAYNRRTFIGHNTHDKRSVLSSTASRASDSIINSASIRLIIDEWLNQ
ncbi:hypothetical protein FHS16_003833 [Paenibacillus endophyticus]|uniref:Uncharacterized protein n=1 Tax=Paenibacillus endophyticus TaxID=1294268 RepID=A0A7W5GBT5_9BACL|nr:hypothetical protein [Paenibacillus endophyticus]